MAPLRSPSTVTTTGRLLSQALLSTGTSLSWTPSHEDTLHHFLRMSNLPLTPPLLSSTIDPHLLRHHPLALGLFHWASHQPNFHHTPHTFHSLLRSLSLSRQSHSILSLLSHARSSRIPLPTPSYHLAISSLVRTHMPLDAFKLIFEVPFSSSDDSCRKSCNLVLGSLAGSGHLKHARQLFDEMLLRGVRVESVGFGVFLGRYCRNVELDDCLLMVGEVRRREWEVNGSIMALLVVDGFVREGKNEEAWQALEELRVRGYKPDFIAYRVVAEAFKLGGRVEEAARILKQKRKLGVAPRISDYKEFIFSLISTRLIEVAKEIGNAIVEGNFPIDDDVLNALISSTSNADPDSAVAFCMYMLRQKKCLEFATLVNLCRNLCRNKKVDEMWDILRILMLDDYFMDMEGYKMAISFLCKGKKVRESYIVIKDMKKRGFNPDVSIYTILMEACCKEDLLRPAKRLWDEMFKTGCGSDLQTYNILIQKFSEIDDVEEAYRLFCHMLEKGVVPNGITYMSLIDVLCRKDKLDDACMIFNKSVEQDVFMAGSFLSTLILGLCKKGNFAASLKLLNVFPSDIDASDSHVILLRSLSESGNIARAIEHLNQVRSNSPGHLQKILNDLFASLSTAPKMEPILQLLQALSKCGLVPECSLWMEDMHDRV